MNWSGWKDAPVRCNNQITPFSALKRGGEKGSCKPGEGGGQSHGYPSLMLNDPSPRRKRWGALPSRTPLRVRRTQPCASPSPPSPLELGGGRGSRPAVRSPRRSRRHHHRPPASRLSLSSAHPWLCRRCPRPACPPGCSARSSPARAHVSVYPPPPSCAENRACAPEQGLDGPPPPARVMWRGGRGSPTRRGGTRSLKRPPDSESRKPAPSPNYGIIVFILPLYKEGTKVIVESCIWFAS